MNLKHAKIFLLAAILVGVIRTSTVVAGSGAGIFAHGTAAWTDLTFRGAANSVKMRIRMQLRSPLDGTGEPMTRSGAKLSDCGQTGKDIKLLAIERTAQGMVFFSENYSEHVWFSPADGRATRRIRWRQGTDPWIKNYCWTDGGVRRKSIRPGRRNEDRQSPDQWTQITESFYPYPERGAGCVAMSDPTVVFYLLSILEPDGLQPPFDICVFGKKQMHRLTFRREASMPADVSFTMHSPSGTTTVKTALKPLVWSVRTAPLGAESEKPEMFSLLGLQEEIRVTIDSVRHLPIRVCGKNADVGSMVFDLVEAHLNHARP